LGPNSDGWVFVIKGDGPLRHHFERLIREKGLSERVFLYTDELPRADLPALYRCFDVFSLPTRREGFGLVFAEAMAMGVPVVGPRMAPITEVVPEDCGLLVGPENAGALAEAIAALMADKALRYQLAEKGRTHALANWCDRRAAGRVIDVYRELLVSGDVREG
jgi:glycosyltransferase involved in cell wall biosynthesis